MILLVRHGKAHSEREDPERSLTPEGRREVEAMARFLEPLRLPVTAIRHSTKTRARQTAEILAAALHPGRGVAERAGLSPNDPVDPIAYELRAGGEGLCLVGHLPFMDRLAARLVGASPELGVARFAPASVLALERTETGGWAVAWMVTRALIAGA